MRLVEKDDKGNVLLAIIFIILLLIIGVFVFEYVRESEEKSNRVITPSESPKIFKEN